MQHRQTFEIPETRFSQIFREIGLIGEIPLSDDKEIEIENALRELLRSRGPAEATQFLREEAQCTLACFLVWKGIRGYHEGNYWTEVCQSVGLPQANWPSKWGEIFEETLQRFNLADFRDSGGRRFVTPILIHGGIPDYCLDDFFEQLIWPAVVGKLYYDGNADHLIAEWQEHSSLTLSADKPVRRFLENGGKVAADFLQRCLNMAIQAYDTEHIPSAKALGLSDHIVERFSLWIKKTAPGSPAQTYRHADLPRYRAPEIVLNAAAGCLLLSFPSQRLPYGTLVRGAGLKLEVRRNGSLLTTVPVHGAVKGEMVETDSCDLDLGTLGERDEVTLFTGDKQLRKWVFSGISSNHPWMIFHGRSGRLLQERAVTERDFWIVFPTSWEISTTIQAIEATTLTRDYQAKHFCIAEGSPPDIRLTHDDERSFLVPIEWIDTPTLSPEHTFTWPRVSSGEFEVYWGTPPSLLIPLPFNEQGPTIPERLHLTIIPTGESYPSERREIPLKTLPGASSLKDRCLTLSLTDPRFLGLSPCGRFTLQVRGRLGQDTTFRLCILPEIKFHFPPERLIPDLNSRTQTISFTLESPHLKELVVEPPAEGASYNSTPENKAKGYQVEVPAESEQVILRPHLSVGEVTVEIPLKIPVSRFRWTVSGLNEAGPLHWYDRPVIIPLQELEEVQEVRLLVRGDLGQDIACVLSLQGVNHQKSFELKNGKGGCPLSPFLDSLRENGLSRNDFYLEFSLPGEDSLTRLCLLQVETSWLVEALQVIQELIPAEDKRTALFVWRDKGNVKNRMLRLWSLGSQSRDPIEVTVEDSSSEAVLEGSLSDFPNGLYRLELTVSDPWAGSLPTAPPSPYESNVFDLEVRETGITIFDSPARYIEALLESIKTGVATSDLILDPQTLQIFVSQPEQARKFCKAVLAREEGWGDSFTLFHQILQQCGEQQDTFVESLAEFLIEQNDPVMENVIHLFARLCVGLGFLNRRWGPNLRQLLLSSKEVDLLVPAKPEEDLHNAQEEISALYAQANWQSLDPARRFLQRLNSISGELIYRETSRKTHIEKEHKLLELEETPGRDNSLLWWKTVGGRISISLGEARNILPRRLHLPEVLCLTATLQRAGAYGVLSVPENIAEKVNLWGCFFYRTRRQEYSRELGWAEEAFWQ